MKKRPTLPRPDFSWRLGEPVKKYDTPWIRVDEFPAVDPNGRDTAYGVVHFKNLAVGILPFENGHIWLVGQSRVTFQSYSWEIPAGGDPGGRDPLATAHRELREETGFSAQHMEQILTMELSNSITDERCHVFLATGLTAGKSEPESSEDISLMKLSLDAALEAVEAGEIRQSLSVAALLQLDRMRAAGRLDGL
jgi:8-oxo-dGTP pyrophosphatase MutT (NUDIX family)